MSDIMGRLRCGLEDGSCLVSDAAKAPALSLVEIHNGRVK